MVYSRVPEEMEIGNERSSKPLHNFTLPCSLKWGNQKHLRCMKVNDNDDDHQNHHQQRNLRQRRSPPSKFNSASIITTRRQLKLLNEGKNDDEEEGIEAVREKIMKDLKTAADKMKDVILREERVTEETEEEEEEIRPWNLRTRRAACKAPIGGPSNNIASSSSPMMRSEKEKVGPEKKEKLKFKVALSKKEIEEDFMKMVGTKPPRRPKRRPKNVQRQLDTLFPGLWLTEVTPDSYKVEVPEDGKR